jgi:hypothetical protein
MEDNVEFETISAETVNFGKSNFIEIARKKAKRKDGETEFISISRGYTAKDGTPKYTKSMTIPDDPEVKAFLAEKLGSI